jgi:REP element-mobilizing transposase RayT
VDPEVVSTRKAIRLRDFDYSTPGGYLVTICTHHRQSLLGQCRDDKVRLTAAGAAVETCWLRIPVHFAVELDMFVVMPNHVHGILVLVKAGHAPPLRTVVGSFKSAATRDVNRLRGTPGAAVWQRSYHDHVIRDERDLERIRGYITANPIRWALDPENLYRRP